MSTSAVSRTASSWLRSRAARWVEPPPAIFAAVSELFARDDRVPARPVFAGFGSDRFRTALGLGRTAAGLPTFSPHDLRHRRVSLLHAQGSHGHASASASDTATSSRRRGRTRTSSSTRPSSTI